MSRHGFYLNEPGYELGGGDRGGGKLNDSTCTHQHVCQKTAIYLTLVNIHLSSDQTPLPAVMSSLVADV